MQDNLKAKLTDNFFTNPTTMVEMKSQINKIAAAETGLKGFVRELASKNGVEIPQKQKSETPPTVPSAPSSTVKPVNQLKELEEKERKKAESNFEKLTKSKAPIRDARKLLDSYKSTTKAKSTEPGPLFKDMRAGLPSNKDEWTPLEYLRHFATNKKKIDTDFNHIIFGPVKFLKSTKCNFRNNKVSFATDL